MPDSPSDVPKPAFREALRFWGKLGLISFGGPTGQIAIMHDEVVERRKWVSEERFLHALNYCMLLPGPEAQQLATYLGWLLHGTRGGIAAGVLFVLPSAALLFLLSWGYMVGQDAPWILAAFAGLKAAVLGIVVQAGWRIGKRVLKNPALWAIAVGAFAAIALAHLPYPLIIGAAALTGWLGRKWWPGSFGGAPLPDSPPALTSRRADLGRALRVTGVCVVLWVIPILLAGGLLGWSATQAQQGVFFSKAAMVTFGGAYAVLPYVGQQAVQHYSWLSAPQMMDGLGLAETTPGPLIMVLQFVGFAGGWQHPPDGWSPLASATLSAALTTWVTFVPCFLWILAGAPFIDRLRHHAGLSSALTAVTAAVVGVIANLAVWFGAHTLFPGRTGAEMSWRPDFFILSIAVAAFLLLQRTRAGVIPVVLGAAALGVVFR